jgi:hypothetical protein
MIRDIAAPCISIRNTHLGFSVLLPALIFNCDSITMGINMYGLIIHHTNT